jgi:hypothetical protein
MQLFKKRAFGSVTCLIDLTSSNVALKHLTIGQFQALLPK